MKTNRTHSFKQLANCKIVNGTLTVVILFTLISCKASQFIEFEGFTVDKGIFKAKPEWEFLRQSNGSFIVALRNNNGQTGGTIMPCDCVQEGSCVQVTAEENGQITDIWCASEGCDICIGGIVANPGSEIKSVKFRLEKSYNQKVKN